VPRSHRFVRLAALTAGMALTGVVGARPAVAQGITFTPFVGSLYTLSKYFDADIDLSNFGGSGTANFTMEQTNTVAFGARLAMPIGATFSIEGAGSYSSSEVRFTGTDAAGPGVDLATNLKGSVITGSLRGVYRPRRSNLNIIGGLAVVHHGGEAWDFDTNETLTNIGGVIGFGLRAQVTPRFALNITAEAFLYSFDPDESNDTQNGFFESKMQSDLIVSIGIPIQLSGR
jgi:hypothetical protein